MRITDGNITEVRHKKFYRAACDPVLHHYNNKGVRIDAFNTIEIK
jgi:hypothetical protein